MIKYSILLFIFCYFIIFSNKIFAQYDQCYTVTEKDGKCKIIKHVFAYPPKKDIFAEFTCIINKHIEGFIYEIEFEKSEDAWRIQSDSLGLKDGNFFLKIFFNDDRINSSYCKGEIIMDSTTENHYSRPAVDIKQRWKWIKYLIFDIKITYNPDFNCRVHYKIIKSDQPQSIKKKINCPTHIYYPLKITSTPQGAKIILNDTLQAEHTDTIFQDYKYKSVTVKVKMDGHEPNPPERIERNLKPNVENEFHFDLNPVEPNRILEYIIFGATVGGSYGIWYLLHKEENAPKKIPAPPNLPE